MQRKGALLACLLHVKTSQVRLFMQYVLGPPRNDPPGGRLSVEGVVMVGETNVGCEMSSILSSAVRTLAGMDIHGRIRYNGMCHRPTRTQASFEIRLWFMEPTIVGALAARFATRESERFPDF
eukprot:142035-Pyramimonas_sp.AAC.1